MLLVPCIGCKRVFTCNPDLVPSLLIEATGVKHAVCLDCVTSANPKRIKNGLPPITVLPGAYDPQEA